MDHFQQISIEKSKGDLIFVVALLQLTWRCVKTLEFIVYRILNLSFHLVSLFLELRNYSDLQSADCLIGEGVNFHRLFSTYIDFLTVQTIAADNFNIVTLR
jgi:hypothetical protein